MATTLMQLRRLVRSRLGVPITDDFFPDRVLDDGVNMAIQTIEAEARWPWSDAGDLVVIGPTNPDIVPPVDWRATRAVFCGEEELISVSPVDILTWLDETTSDIPKVWAPLGEIIVVRPTPSTDTVLRHIFYRQSTWLRDDTDVTTIPEQYTGAIVAKAAQLLATSESSGADVSRHGEEYSSWVQRMRRDVRSATGPTRTRVRPGGWI